MFLRVLEDKTMTTGEEAIAWFEKEWKEEIKKERAGEAVAARIVVGGETFTPLELLEHMKSARNIFIKAVCSICKRR